MKKYSVAIIDDEKDAIELLSLYIKKNFPQLEIMGTAQYIDEIIHLLQDTKPDLIFMDVEIKGLNSFEILERLNLKNQHNLIFITAHEKYAIQAFGANALNFVLKPIQELKLIKVIENSLSKIDAYHLQEKSQAKLIKYGIPTSKKIKVTNIDEIIYCRSDSSYTIFYTINGKKVIASKSLKEIQQKLPEDHFYRVHQSYLINLMHVVEYDVKNNELILSNETTVPVSRSNRVPLKNRLNQKLIS